MKEWNGKSFVGYLKKVVIEQAREIEVLEGKLKTAKADGIREAATEVYCEEEHGADVIHVDNLIQYADQLEADNEQD